MRPASGGGIPILRPLDQCLAANEVYEIAGILNGTTNFMLTQMVENDMSFDDALALAQRLGYAERDPSADIDGARRLPQNLYPGLPGLWPAMSIRPRSTRRVSRKVTLEDVNYAAAMERRNQAHRPGRRSSRMDGCTPSCPPMILPRSSLLADVNDVFNGIMVRGDAIGDVVFYGRGAGKLPTASAVVADVIDEVKHLHARKYLFWERGQEGYVADYRQGRVRMFLRLACADADSGRSAVEKAFGPVERVCAGGGPGGRAGLRLPRHEGGGAGGKAPSSGRAAGDQPDPPGRYCKGRNVLC